MVNPLGCCDILEGTSSNYQSHDVYSKLMESHRPSFDLLALHKTLLPPPLNNFYGTKFVEFILKDMVLALQDSNIRKKGR